MDEERALKDALTAMMASIDPQAERPPAWEEVEKLFRRLGSPGDTGKDVRNR